MYNLPQDFDRVIAVDWSARSAPTPVKASADAIYTCETLRNHRQSTVYHRTRMAAFDVICQGLDTALERNETVLLGFDFAFGYPRGFAEKLMGDASVFAVWKWFADHIEDDTSNANNRFEIAAEINRMFPGTGPFWGAPANVTPVGLPHKGSARKGTGLTEKRLIEQVVTSTQSVWKLYTTGSVGSQVLMGLPYLHKLRERYGNKIAFWPFDDAPAQINVFEIYPSISTVNYATPLEDLDPIFQIKDAQQVKMVCDSILKMAEDAELWDRFTRPLDDAHVAAIAEEGWIFGVTARRQP